MSLDSSSGHHEMMTDNYTLCNLDSHTYLHISSYDRHGNREAGTSEERSGVRAEGSLGAYHGYHSNSMVMRQPPIDYERFVGKGGNNYHYNNSNNNNNNNSSNSNNDNEETRNVADSSSVVCSTKDEDNYRLAKDNKEEAFDDNNNDNSDNNVVIRVIAPEDEPCDWRYKNYNSNNNSELNGRHVDSKMNLYQQQQQQQQVSYSYDDEQLASGARVQSAHIQFAHLHDNDSIQQSPNYYHGDREAPVGFFAGAFGPPQHHHHHHQFSSSERAAYQLPSSSEPSTCLTSNSNSPPQVTSAPMISFSDSSAFNVTASIPSTTNIDSNDKSNNKHGFSTSSPTPQNPGIDQQQQQQQRLPSNTPSSMHPLSTSDYSASSYYYPYHNSLPVPLLNPTYNATSNNNNTVQQMENSIFTSRYFTGGGPVSPISPAQFYSQYHPHTNTVDQGSSNLYPHQNHHTNHPHQLLYADRAFGGLSGVFGVEGARGIVSSNIYAGFQPQGQGSLRNGLPSPPTFLMGGATLDGGGLLGPHFPHHHLGLSQDHQLVSSTGGSTSSSSSSTTNASGLATYKWMTVKRGSPRTTSKSSNARALIHACTSELFCGNY